MSQTYQTLRLILGDQLNAGHSWYSIKDEGILYVIAELNQETSYVKHHVQKVCAFFAAMKAFAVALQKAGHNVSHLTLDDTHQFATLPELLNSLIARYGIAKFEYQLPDEYRLREQLSAFCAQIDIESGAYESEHFYLSDSVLSSYFSAGKKHRLEAFYRKMRVRFNILMDGSTPFGGEWNFDSNNRNKLKQKDLSEIPEPLVFANDVSDIWERLQRHQVSTFGTYEANSLWPITRAQAKELLCSFCETQLPKFGFFQDAMTCKADDMYTKKQWSLYHSRLSFALNSKIISPQFVVDTVVAYFMQHQQEIDIAQVEGFVRQIIGWREFVRGIYWVNMPQYAGLNELDAKRDLPDWFWDGKTHMNCQKHAVKQSLDYAYAHHIQRLMVTGNFCLIAGIDPRQVDDWYLGVYIDAIEWVEMPNTRGMSQFADGGIVGSKAYAASGNYVNKMSDYCSDCQYDIKSVAGHNACPLNSLYWHFMDTHEGKFSSNPRNRMVYANWRKKAPEQRALIMEQAAFYLDNLNKL
ncbi:cryptochrome/photolyase family protein [Pseudoalteromonas luteoviolacea]|uniref:cryptochrome/photolyase family protein n=1 Tax=Pseudoalteromonas luteoviolacea TaxID=43657 RepID=UPI001B3A1FEE|nr:cryptochrome/photolyase family protein [Pseudoalteromonas luteoviolacea]MBQ4876392.1 cryptochrome/photolyase family protein [Pseudoalteromonas luteoviolacea]MBQ4905023.1 cryptochrome/photolyase family protein [Pseudoalteromonas luteoviolacea]